MNKQTDIDVIINGKQYTLSGYESGEYLQKVASYINAKYAELKKHESYMNMNNDMKGVMLQLNIADDYFKLMQQLKEREEENDIKSSELFELKHEMISLQSRLETMEKELEQAKAERYEEEKKNIRLEAELGEVRKKTRLTFAPTDHKRKGGK